MGRLGKPLGGFLEPLGGLWSALGCLLAGFWGLLGGLFASPRGAASKGETPKWTSPYKARGPLALGGETRRTDPGSKRGFCRHAFCIVKYSVSGISECPKRGLAAMRKNESSPFWPLGGLWGALGGLLAGFWGLLGVFGAPWEASWRVFGASWEASSRAQGPAL